MDFVNTSVFLCTTVLIAVSKRSCGSVVEYLPVMYTFKKTPNTVIMKIMSRHLLNKGSRKKWWQT